MWQNVSHPDMMSSLGVILSEFPDESYLILLSHGVKHKEVDAINAIVISTIDVQVNKFKCQLNCV